jgi:DNA-binding NarL/FixJ family response regulator
VNHLADDVPADLLFDIAPSCRGFRYSPDMRVLCMSGYTEDGIVRHGVLEGHIAFLQKPLTPDALARRVLEVLDGARNGGTL